MSTPDSFIEEVTEEVRRDRLFAVFRRYGWIAILAVVAVVAGAAWNEWQKARAQSSAEIFGDAVLAAIDLPDPAARLAALSGLAATGDQAAVLGFLTASEAVKADDRAAALTKYQTLADDASLPKSYRDMAALKRVILIGADQPIAGRAAVLQPLSAAGQPFRALALEQLALLKLEAGEIEAAVTQLRALLQEPNLTAGLQRRASGLMVALGADPEAQ